MVKEVTVTDVGYSCIQKCVTTEYENAPNDFKKAAVAELLSVRVGDKVFILKNDDLNYKGYDTVAVLLA